MNLVWLRRDLRIQDHPALAKALEDNTCKTQILYIATEKQWKKHNESDISIEFRKRRVNQLAVESGSIGIRFEKTSCDMFKDIPELLLNYCMKNKVRKIYFLKETPFDENQRDKKVISTLSKHSIEVHAFDYDLIVSQPVLSQNYQPYKVFTPYYKKWLSMIENPKQWLKYKIRQSHKPITNAIPFEIDKKFDLKLSNWSVSSSDIYQKLQTFCSSKLEGYQQNRDYPALNCTSMFSPYLSFGMLGPRQCLSAIKRSHDLKKSDWRHDFWLRELTWRDFYRQLMIHFPHISKNKNFNRTINIHWDYRPELIEKWQNGETGFPIIDAAMRQLKETGWMHNRLRMIVAVFFTKILFQDWRVGEKWFMENLIDGEFAANNGGWQWSASTGCDAVPYFRIFNPYLQSQKFDSEGTYIRRYVPELMNLSNKEIHNPTDSTRKKCQYPKEIVDYQSAKNRTIQLFKQSAS